MKETKGYARHHLEPAPLFDSPEQASPAKNKKKKPEHDGVELLLIESPL